MTCNTIYTSALALVGESKHTAGTASYLARAPQLLTVILFRLSSIASLLSGSDIYPENLIVESLDAYFPVDVRLMPVCSYMLASMLIFDELPELSEKLDAEAKKTLEAISDKLSTVGGIGEVYPS